MGEHGVPTVGESTSSSSSPDTMPLRASIVELFSSGTKAVRGGRESCCYLVRQGRVRGERDKGC